MTAIFDKGRIVGGHRGSLFFYVRRLSGNRRGRRRNVAERGAWPWRNGREWLVVALPQVCERRHELVFHRCKHRGGKILPESLVLHEFLHVDDLAERNRDVIIG